MLQLLMNWHDVTTQLAQLIATFFGCFNHATITARLPYRLPADCQNDYLQNNKILLYKSAGLRKTLN